MKIYEPQDRPPLPPVYSCYEHGQGVPVILIHTSWFCAICFEGALQNLRVRRIQAVGIQKEQSQSNITSIQHHEYDKRDRYEQARSKLQQIIREYQLGAGISPSVVAEYVLSSLKNLEYAVSSTRPEV